MPLGHLVKTCLLQTGGGVTGGCHSAQEACRIISMYINWNTISDCNVLGRSYRYPAAFGSLQKFTYTTFILLAPQQPDLIAGSDHLALLGSDPAAGAAG
jgi:hypothetical protein